MKSKKSNIAIWLFSTLLIVLAVINQQVMHYKHIFWQFIVTTTLILSTIYVTSRKTEQGIKTLKYLLDAISELKKVTWPTKKETMQTTLAVVVMVVVMGLILWTVDAILIKVVAWLLERGAN